MKSLMNMDELESAVQISLCSKARWNGENGYWADLLGPVNCGSLMWTLDREYLNPEAEVKAKSCCFLSLRYLKDLGFVKRIDATTRSENGKMMITVKLDGREQDVSL